MTVQDFLMSVLGYSRRIITRIKLNREDISRNGSHIRMVDRLFCGDILKITLREETRVKPNFELSVPVIYEDSDIIVYNKPPFMPVHPSSGHQLDTLANAFCGHMHKLEISAAFHPINRLDRDTSGLCVVAKNALAAGIMNKGMDKVYTAVVCGEVLPEKGRIEAPIKREDDSMIKRCVGEGGQFAATNYEVIHKMNNYTLVRIKLETGRTHQIRVHFAYIGNPLAGDSLYGGDMSVIQRQALCCTEVSFIHPITNKCVNLSIDIQEDMHKLVYSV